MTSLLLAVCAAAFLYQLAAIAACLRHLSRPDPMATRRPPISILKPIHGLDPHFYQAIRSHAILEYPTFEILFGVSELNDPAVREVMRIQSDFPDVPMNLLHAVTQTPNGKVGVLADLARHAKYDVILVNDSDIRVPSRYLEQVAAPLEDPGVGIVTCLYRASAETSAGAWEALGIATDFVPSVLVAPLFGVKEFGLGSTLVFRKQDLEKIGGFLAIRDYLADDYQLARRITGLGLRAHMSRTVVETSLQAATWGEIWRHQLRWHRTIRVSRGAYAGLPITNASLWALIAAICGHPLIALALLIARLATAVLAGRMILQCPITRRWIWLVPFRDLWGLAVWFAGMFGTRVQWRDQHLQLTPDGRIKR